MLTKFYGRELQEEAPTGMEGGGEPAPVVDAPAPVIDTALAPAAPAAPVEAPVEATPTEIAPFYDSLPDTWRNELVNALDLESDVADKRLTQLTRVPDFKTLAKNYFESQDKIREGVKPVGLSADSTAEQITEYREANGIPMAAEGYRDALDAGLVLGDADGRIMDEVYKVAHTENVSSSAMSKLTTAMLNARVAEQEAMMNQHGIDTQTAKRQLKEAWGPDYQTNINMISGLVNQLPESIRNDFHNAKLGNGRALFNSPEFAIFMADMARKVNPAGTVVPNSNNPMQAINDEIKSLEAKMGDDAWYKDTASQERLRQLYTAADGMNR